ncbi:MAG: Gfo/Idh/MocA family oxidoreductase [Ignavibacteriae bacterium]|nr:Gfo/Idh/MocA family oxidoreductase [Ignavibacteriota bacterium]
MNGVTGRMGSNQHLMRSIVAIMRQGGVRLNDREVVMPDPILVGRNAQRLEQLAASSGIVRWTTDLGKALADTHNTIYFDAQVTNLRVPAIRAAIKAGKHIYCEKPTALTTDEAYDLYLLAEEKGVKHGVVQDKLWLPGLIKLRLLRDSGFFGRILSVKGDFGYWVFEGEHIPAQRPSWNYRVEDGGGIIFDMLCHWRYVLDNVIAPVRSVSCLGATHVPTRWDESGKPYACTADDAAYATFELNDGIVAQFNSSWTTRVRRDDLLTIQVDGTLGSAVAGLRDCVIQPAHATPRPTWNPDVENPFTFLDQWMTVPSQQAFDNAFKIQWELYLRHIAANEPFPWDLLEGAKGVQLAEKGIESWKDRKWIPLPDLKIVQKG